jgi:hypothetical protein
MQINTKHQALGRPTTPSTSDDTAADQGLLSSIAKNSHTLGAEDSDFELRFGMPGRLERMTTSQLLQHKHCIWQIVRFFHACVVRTARSWGKGKLTTRSVDDS